MNANLNGSNPYQQSPYAPGTGGAINPALLASFQNQNPTNKQKFQHPPNTTPTPAQLISSMSLSGMPTQHQQQQHFMSINPTQVLQQQHALNGMNMDGGSINPSALSSPSHQPSIASSSSHLPPSPSSAPSLLGMSTAQFMALSPQDRQTKMMLVQQANLRDKQLQHAQMQAMGIPTSNQQAGMNMGMPSLNNAGQQQPPFRDQSLMAMQQQQPFRDQNLAMNMRMGMPRGQQQFRDQQTPAYPSQQQQIMNMGMGSGIGIPSGGIPSGMFTQTNHNQLHNQQNQDMLQGLARTPSAIGTHTAPFYDRPLSSGSSPTALGMQHQQQSQDQHMMPPPSNIPRGMGGMNTGGRDLNFNTRNVPAGNAGLMRPPSRAMTATPLQDGLNGFAPTNTAQRGMSPSQIQNLQNPYPQNQGGFGGPQLQGQAGFASNALHHQQPPSQIAQLQQQHRGTPTPTSTSPPLPGSPYRGAKRKVGDSPRIGTLGTGLPGGVPMGRPQSIPRTLSASSGDMNNMIPGYNASLPLTHRPSSSMGINGLGPGGMGTGSISGEMADLLPPQQPQASAHQQRHGSVPRQGSVPLVKPERVSPAESLSMAHGEPSFRSPGGVAPVTTAAVAALPTALPSSSTASLPVVGSQQPAQLQPPGPTHVQAPTQAPAAQLPIIPSLPPLPAGVSLNPAFTRVTVVPLVDSLMHIPPLSDQEIADIKGWTEVDREYEGTFRAMKKRAEAEKQEAMFGWGKVPWWEKGGGGVEGAGNMNRWRRSREMLDVRYPRSRRDGGGSSGRRRGKREGIKL